MKIEFAHRKIMMLHSKEDGTLDVETVKAFYPEAMEGDQINYQKIIPLLVESLKDIQQIFDNMNDVINYQQQQIEEIKDARSLT